MQIRMTTTAEAINADGVLQVFGPEGRTYDIDDDTAERLIDQHAAEPIDAPKRKTKRSE